jgi:uncharacterized protein (TIGR02266 family)
MSEGARLELRFSTKEEFEKEYNENLSKGGIFIATPDPPPLRSRVEFTIFAPDREIPITLTGEVVHVIGSDQQIPGMEPGVALQILNYNKEMDQRLRNLFLGDSAPEQAESAGPAGTASEKAEEAEPGGEASEGLEASPEQAGPEGEAPEEPEPAQDSEAEEAEVEKTVQGFKGLNPENLFMSLRRLPRNEKIKLAKLGPKKVLNLLIQEGDKQIMRFVVQNPRLGIPEVLAILKNPLTSMEIIQAIGKNSGFMQSD